MKKGFDKFKEKFYAFLPILILFGIPLAIGLGIFIVWKWDTLKELSFFDILNGIFGAIGAFNIGVGIMLTVEKMDSKKNKGYWIYIYLILTAIGIVALSNIITKVYL